MPYLFAHGLCAVKVRGMLDREALPLGRYDELYRWGAQGPDLWFYHRPLEKKGTLRGFGNRMHAEHVEDTLGAMLEACLAVQGEEREKRFAYFGGFLTHYALDAVAHPYILCRCGGHFYHTRFECELDVALLEQEGTSIRQKRTYDQMPPVEGRIVALMHEAAARAWGEPLPEGEALRAVRQARQGLVILNDPRGWKRGIVRVLETLIGRKGAFSRGIYPTATDPDRDVLNLKKNIWHIPWSGEERRDTFLELIDAAAGRARGYLQTVWSCLEGCCGKEEALAQLGGFSLDNGLPWREAQVEERFYDGVYQKP